MTTQEKWLYQRVFLNGHLSKWQSLAISLMYEQEDGFITDVYASRIQQERKKNTTLSQHFQNPIEKSQKEIQLDTPNMQIHDRSLYWLGTGTSKSVMSIIQNMFVTIVKKNTNKNVDKGNTKLPNYCLKDAVVTESSR